MMMKLSRAAAIALIAAACAAPGAAPAEVEPVSATATATASTADAVNPVGHYEFTTTVQGQAVTGAVHISGSPGAYTGQITNSMTPPLSVTGVTVDGREMVLTGPTRDGTFTVRLTFTDATNFTGTWAMSGDSGSLTGRRVS